MGSRIDDGGKEDCDDRTREGETEGNRLSNGRVLRARRYRQLVPERVRQKRQTLQAMVRPLKQWLYRHRHNPYPSRQQKQALASDSHMTLTQVSNWFANARRRLKNTVREPGLPWAARIARYNSCVEGNAERFSLDSDDSIWDSEDDVCDSTTGTNPPSPSPNSRPLRPSPLGDHPGSSTSSSSTHARPDDVMHVDCPKYKHSILQRYLADAYRQAGHSHQGALLDTSGRGRHQSGSLGSHDSEEMSTSSVSSRHADHHHGLDDLTEELESTSVRGKVPGGSRLGQDEDMYWKEFNAAVVLANLSTGCHWS